MGPRENVQTRTRTSNLNLISVVTENPGDGRMQSENPFQNKRPRRTMGGTWAVGSISRETVSSEQRSDVSALAAARTRRTFPFDSGGRFERRFRLTCRRPGRIQIVRNHCLLWNFRRCRSGAVVRPRRFQTVASRFVAGCRPFLMSAIRPLTKKNINTNTPKYLLNV